MTSEQDARILKVMGMAVDMGRVTNPRLRKVLRDRVCTDYRFMFLHRDNYNDHTDKPRNYDDRYHQYTDHIDHIDHHSDSYPRHTDCYARVYNGDMAYIGEGEHTDTNNGRHTDEHTDESR
jgi:hypothetical protein